MKSIKLLKSINYQQNQYTRFSIARDYLNLNEWAGLADMICGPLSKPGNSI